MRGVQWLTVRRIGRGERARAAVVEMGITEESGRGITPLTYMNSTAAIKAFCGERGGLVCTSSNAAGAFRWAFQRNQRILFLPDQHLGRNTAFAMGIPLSECVVW